MSVKEELEQLLKPKQPEPAPIAPKPKRSLGNIAVALEAQKVYNPALPSIPKPTAAPSNPEAVGTTPGLGPSTGWRGSSK